jgi:hypothetical protein
VIGAIERTPKINAGVMPLIGKKKPVIVVSADDTRKRIVQSWRFAETMSPLTTRIPEMIAIKLRVV